MELWKDIPDYENLYQASTLGRIRSLPRNTTRGCILAPKMTGPKTSQYHGVQLWKEGIPSTQKIHRLIALTFLTKVGDKTTVDHIDRDKFNNCLSNLRWANQSEQNLNRYYDLGRSGHRHITPRGDRWVVQICWKGSRQFYKSCESLDDAIDARDSYLELIDPGYEDELDFQE